MRDLQGKRVLVTGGAQGIGFLMAREFGRHGAELVLTDVAGETLAQATQTLTGEGMRVSGFEMDVTDHEAIAETRTRILEEAGAVDVLVNNAGVVFGGAFGEVPLERHQLTYRVNTIGLINVTHAFLDDLVARPEAQLVNIASASGLVGLPFGATYASSKWAVIGFSESMRLELQQQGHTHVGVTTVCPSFINTGMFDGVKTPMLTPMLDPEALARQVVAAVEKNKPVVMAPGMVKAIPWLKAMLPARLLDRASHALGVTSAMSTWKGKH